MDGLTFFGVMNPEIDHPASKGDNGKPSIYFDDFPIYRLLFIVDFPATFDEQRVPSGKLT